MMAAYNPSQLAWSEGWQLLGAQSAFIKWTEWTLTITLPWWKHYKYCRDVIACFKLGYDRFRGLASAEGQILPFPIDFDGRPYNTLTLPCERVIIHFLQTNQSVAQKLNQEGPLAQK